MSIAAAFAKPAHRRFRLRFIATEVGSALLALVLLIWSLLPIYNMSLIALDPEEGEIEFDGNLWVPRPSLAAFRAVLMQEARYLEDFWHQFANSLFTEYGDDALDPLDRVAGETLLRAGCGSARVPSSPTRRSSPTSFRHRS